MNRLKHFLSIFLTITFLFTISISLGNAEETWIEPDIQISDDLSNLLAFIEREEDFENLSAEEKYQAAELVLEVVEELDEEEIAAIWPLIGQWVANAMNYLASQSNTINHILKGATHLWEEAGIFAANQLLPIIQQVLQTGTKVYQGNDLWHIYGTWNGWSVTVVGRIMDGLFKISDAWLNYR